jgi:hypothetical protein
MKKVKKTKNILVYFPKMIMKLLKNLLELKLYIYNTLEIE